MLTLAVMLLAIGVWGCAILLLVVLVHGARR